MAETAGAGGRGIEVSVHDDSIESAPDDPFEADTTVESAFFAETEPAAQWLVDRGCSPGEAARITDTALRLVMSQSTGTGPTRTEQILDATIEV